MDIKLLTRTLTLKEKALLLSGKNNWETHEIARMNIPSFFLSDGPHGLRKQEGKADHLGLNESRKSTCFPTAATIANSWDETLARKIGEAIGEEAISQDVDVVLGPGLNIKRDPRGGRNFEYFSEDPYLAGKMAASYIKGIQATGTFACPKHFAANSQETRRMASDSEVDLRSLREIYLTGFEIAVKEAHPKAMMSAYNKVNGVYANENAFLLRDVLKQEWGFDGFVVSDWGGSNDHVLGVQNGSHLEMPSTGAAGANEIIQAIQNGELSEQVLDERISELLTVLLSKETKSGSFSSEKESEHHQLAKEAALKSAVLLKNEAAILPLKKGTKVALIGEFAKKPRYQGAGSSLVNPTRLEAATDIIRDYPVEFVGFETGYKTNSLATKPELLKEAVELAKKADVVLLYLGLDESSESEGMDRTQFTLPQNQLELIHALKQVNSNLIGILAGGSSFDLSFDTDLKAILTGYLSGQAGASALLDLLTGKASPSGKLNETYPFRLEDTALGDHFPAKGKAAQYFEALFVGYRYYQAASVPVKYPFGFGLSYSKFAYSDIELSETGVSFQLTNTGQFDAEEISQLYVSMESGQNFRPKRELKAFAKTFLKRGESQTVFLPFDEYTFRYFDAETNQFEIEPGHYKVEIGTSSEAIELSTTVEQKGTVAKKKSQVEKFPHYFSGQMKQVPLAEFEALLGREVTKEEATLTRRPLLENDTIGDMQFAKSALARLAYHILDQKKRRSEKKGKPNLNMLFIYNMPFRAIYKMTAGKIDREMVQGILTIVNGSFWKGLRSVLKARRNGKKISKKILEEE